jgi:hypothetical protein
VNQDRFLKIKNRKFIFFKIFKIFKNPFLHNPEILFRSPPGPFAAKPGETVLQIISSSNLGNLPQNANAGFCKRLAPHKINANFFYAVLM